MANIFDYLDWRADVPLSADPFNEVDNLIFSELSYTDFGGIVPDDGTEIPLPEALAAFFALHTREEILASRSYTARAPFLMEQMADGARFRDVRLCRYVSETDTARDMQFSALTFRMPDGISYVAFRGTDGSVVGWKEDFNITWLPETEGQSRAAAYLDAAGQAIDGPLYVGGHSKGGNLAVYAAAFCVREVQDRILAAFSNDGPGFRSEVIRSDGYQRIRPRIVSIVPEDSVIGLLLSSQVEHRVVGSAANGILQHDGFSWTVRRNRFTDAQLSKSSEFVDKALESFLEQMDDETRRTLVTTVFSLFESTGHDSFSEINHQKWKSAEAIIAATRELPRERQLELLRLIAQLSQSGGHTAADYLSAFLNRKKDGAQ